jgi:serine O-acetyltransferase
MFENVREDWNRYPSGSGRGAVRLLLTQGLWASTEYRFGHWARTASPAWARLFLVGLSIFTHLVVEAVTGISIQPSAEIGPGLFISHFGGLIVNGRVRIGSGCTLGPGVVVGQDVTPPFGTPVIGNGVYIAPGAKVFGGIAIGDNVAIGANAVVRDDIPDRAIAAGVPAKVIRIQDPSEVRAPEIAG